MVLLQLLMPLARGQRRPQLLDRWSSRVATKPVIVVKCGLESAESAMNTTFARPGSNSNHGSAHCRAGRGGRRLTPPRWIHPT